MLSSLRIRPLMTLIRRRMRIHHKMDIGDFDALIDDVVTDQQQAPIASPAVPLRKSSRDRRSSIRYSSNDYVLLNDEGEPECYEEAMESECKDQWVEAMKDELQSLHDNHTFELVKLLE
ncbi:hypothetical protein V6N12_023820 [Hibiscus sabdariffa]|uniref:Retrovirus-related Pol polyprotein from transposon TNT 1-94 n=1 Tax=Hibiscus sabdariffa TaxID=183260 RepID=A0ABR2FZN7_9ROSI